MSGSVFFATVVIVVRLCLRGRTTAQPQIQLVAKKGPSEQSPFSGRGRSDENNGQVDGLRLQSVERFDHTFTHDRIIDPECSNDDEHSTDRELDLAAVWMYHGATCNEEQHRRDEVRGSTGANARGRLNHVFYVHIDLYCDLVKLSVSDSVL